MHTFLCIIGLSCSNSPSVLRPQETRVGLAESITVAEKFQNEVGTKAGAPVYVLPCEFPSLYLGSGICRQKERTLEEARVPEKTKKRR